ncbi:MAG: long-chain-fatty-acid--CoA ligase [Allosphingosinicella sp.]|uniref:long-chain-fatty-acid--CoA ligase n=1 Tax=Allosphingosinicella sp. TaxID=2823234 RepID=UPI0039632C58
MTDPTDIWRTAYRHPVSWDQEFPPCTLPDMFAAAARRNRERPLIDFLGRKFSYAETQDGVNRVAKGLRALGIGKGDRVGLYLPNVPHYVAAYFGALKIGATVVNFSPLYSVPELVQQVEDSGTRLLFTVSAQALLPNAIDVLNQTAVERLVVGSVAGALPGGKSLLYRLFKRKEIAQRPIDPRILAFSSLIANDGRVERADIDPERDVALLQYTGGTTGTPKGAMLTHQNLTANARQVNLIDPDPAAEDRIVGVLPLFHIFANTCVMNRTILRGGEMILLPRFDAAQVLKAVQRTRATALPGVPTMYQALLDHPKTAQADLSSLRICISGGAPMPVEVKQRFEAKTGARLVEGYGLTESSGVVSTNPYEGLNKDGTIGQPIPSTRVVLVSQDDPTRPPPDGEPGEITVSGPQIMKGYWNRPDADAVTFVDGRLRTGDVGRIDADGYVRIVDRMKDMITVGGFKVYPSQVEDVLYGHEAVKEALVIGIADARLGERPKAFVALFDGAAATGEELAEWLNARVGKHERVVAVEVRPALPKTMIGKLSRKELVAEEKARAPLPT